MRVSAIQVRQIGGTRRVQATLSLAALDHRVVVHVLKLSQKGGLVGFLVAHAAAPLIDIHAPGHVDVPVVDVEVKVLRDGPKLLTERRARRGGGLVEAAKQLVAPSRELSLLLRASQIDLAFQGL